MPDSSNAETGEVGRYTPAYYETSQAVLCTAVRDYWKRKDGKVPTRVWVDGDKVLVRFDAPLVTPAPVEVKRVDV